MHVGPAAGGEARSRARLLGRLMKSSAKAVSESVRPACLDRRWLGECLGVCAPAPLFHPRFCTVGNAEGECDGQPLSADGSASAALERAAG